VSLSQVVAEEDERARRYRAENARRRHNFIPFIMALLRGLAERHKLQPLIDQAAERARARAPGAQ
jgi:ubiquitin carboxyl-terminal hydrolase L5